MSIFLSTLTENEYEASLEMVEQAFEQTSIPVSKILERIKRLRYANDYRYELEVIAKTSEGQVIGHAMCSEITIKGAELSYQVLALLSLAVATPYQSKGIGKALVQALEERALNEEYTAIVVLDRYDYFQKLDYEPILNFNIKPPLNMKEDDFKVKFLWDTLEDPPHGQLMESAIF